MMGTGGFILLTPVTMMRGHAHQDIATLFLYIPFRSVSTENMQKAGEDHDAA